MTCYVKAIVPIEIKGTHIKATNITNTGEYGAFSSAETVSKGQIRTYADRNMWSQIDAHSNNKPLLLVSPSAKWALIEAGIQFTFLNGAYSDIANWVAGSYTVGQRVKDNGFMFECVSNTSERPAYVTAEELKPKSDTPWIYHSPSNAMASFDISPSTTTSNPDTITYTVEPPNCTNLAFINAKARTISVKVMDMDNANEVFFEETHNMYLGSASFWEYFFRPRISKKDVVFNFGRGDIKNKRIEITIDNTGAVASFGAWIWGYEFNLGQATGLDLSNKSFSEVIRNKFRLTSIKEGASIKTLSIPMFVEDTEIDIVNDRLNSFSGKPVLIVATEKYRMAVIYGLSLTSSIVVKRHGIINYRLEELY